MVKLSFSYTDEFDQESTLNKTYSEDIFDGTTQFELLVSEFKLFLKASGMSSTLVNKITIID